MKKILVVVVCIVGLLSAKNLKGSFGMGIGWSPLAYVSTRDFPTPDFVITKIGVSDKIIIEPLIGFDFTSYSNGASESGSLIQLQGILGYIFREHKKTNIYLKGGIGFMVESPPGDTPYSSAFGIGIPFGFGLEHFFSDYFSINLDAFSGFSFININDPDGSETSFSLGNHKIFISLMWYY
ncbi:MAG: DUF2715 domain-containing protein [candidate division WOR-3 bacterium]